MDDNSLIWAKEDHDDDSSSIGAKDEDDDDNGSEDRMGTNGKAKSFNRE
jgi:hypothetical protein